MPQKSRIGYYSSSPKVTAYAMGICADNYHVRI